MGTYGLSYGDLWNMSGWYVWPLRRRCPAGMVTAARCQERRYEPAVAAVGARSGSAAGARVSGCAHSRLPPHAALPFVEVGSESSVLWIVGTKSSVLSQ